jgi:hypothetical protein
VADEVVKNMKKALWFLQGKPRKVKHEEAQSESQEPALSINEYEVHAIVASTHCMSGSQACVQQTTTGFSNVTLHLNEIFAVNEYTNNGHHYLVHWTGYDYDESTWEPAAALASTAADAVRDFWNALGNPHCDGCKTLANIVGVSLDH